MKAAVLYGNEDIRYDDYPTPEAGAGEVRVKVLASGICGSDIHVYHGKHPYTSYPVTQGHEVSGQIVELGEGAREDLFVGQKVTIEPQVVCGHCHPCRNGKYNLCESLKVMATDISDYRLELAHKCGADVVVNTRHNDFGKALVDTFGPDKADVIYDCAGNNITMDQAIQNARKGSTIILVAVFADMARCDLAKLNDSELDLNTTMMYRHEDYVDAIRLVGEGKIQLKPLMSKHFAFQAYIKSYEYIDANQETTMKVLIDVDPEDE